MNYKLAIRLTGKFKTAFPEGKPADKASRQHQQRRPKPDDSLKESKAETSVVLFGDADMLADDFSLRKVDSPFGAMVSPMNGNLDSRAKSGGPAGRRQQSHRRAQPRNA